MYRIIKINCYNTQVWCACLLQGCVCVKFQVSLLLSFHCVNWELVVRKTAPELNVVFHVFHQSITYWNKLGLSKLPPLELCTYLLFGMLIYISNSQHFNTCILNFPPIWRTASNCLCLVKVNFSSLLPLVLHCIGNFLKCYLKYKIVILGS